MLPSPLRLNRVFIASLSIEASKDSIETSEVVVEAKPSFAVSKAEPNDWKVCLSVKFDGPPGSPSSYKGSVEVIGFFTVVSDTSDEKRRLKALAIGAPSFLYSTVRETVAFITGRSLHGVFQLPLLLFSDVDVLPLGKAKANEPHAGGDKYRQRRP